VATLSAQHPDEAALIAAYRDRWPEMLGGALDDTVAILDEVRARQPVYALTNWSAETFPHATARFDFLAWFAGIVVSGHEGLKKPDPALFSVLTARYDLDPARTVFIDDSPRNVDAARALGFDAIAFEDAATLRRALVERGVL
jgi:2-haloacid dehalogenase